MFSIEGKEVVEIISFSVFKTSFRVVSKSQKHFVKDDFDWTSGSRKTIPFTVWMIPFPVSKPVLDSLVKTRNIL